MSTTENQPARGLGNRRAFTLIELLIVVAIIGILAAIAIPSFLNAQTRAKVSRTMSDMRSIATGLESYAVDWTRYPPNDGRWGVTPVQITTPIEYITERPRDPFAIRAIDESGNGFDDDAKFYSYHRIVTLQEAIDEAASNLNPDDAIDAPGGNLGAIQRYGKWNQLSIGPDLLYFNAPDSFVNPPPYSFDVSYDPTNGTISNGNIICTQRDWFAYVQR